MDHRWHREGPLGEQNQGKRYIKKLNPRKKLSSLQRKDIFKGNHLMPLIQTDRKNCLFSFGRKAVNTSCVNTVNLFLATVKFLCLSPRQWGTFKDHSQGLHKQKLFSTLCSQQNLQSQTRFLTTHPALTHCKARCLGIETPKTARDFFFQITPKIDQRREKNIVK